MARVAKGADPTMVAKVAPIIKKMGDAKDSAKFDAIQDRYKVARPMAAMILYAAEVVIDPSLKFKLTEANVKKARARGLRIERIAAYTGVSVTQLKNEYGDVLEAHSIGRGRKPSANGASASKKPAAAEKSGPGRPKGSTNKAKTDKVRRRSALSQRP